MMQLFGRWCRLVMTCAPAAVVISVAVVFLSAGAWAWAAPSKTEDPSDGSCNPVVDMLFVLDNSSYVNHDGFLAQKNFIRDILSSHQAPKGAVRVSSVVCVNDSASSTPFTTNVATLLEDLNGMKPPTRSAGQQCLESISLKFQSDSREGVFRIAVLIRAGGGWADTYTKRQAEVTRETRVVMVVVPVGIQDFEILSALQLLAAEEGTFFVLSKYTDLSSLAGNLSQGSCRPITLNLVSESSFDVKRLNQTQKSHPPCLRVNQQTFKRYIPGLGYIRGACSAGLTLNVTSCSCD